MHPSRLTRRGHLERIVGFHQIRVPGEVSRTNPRRPDRGAGKARTKQILAVAPGRKRADETNPPAILAGGPPGMTSFFTKRTQFWPSFFGAERIVFGAESDSLRTPPSLARISETSTQPGSRRQGLRP